MFARITDAIEDIKKGKIIVVVDDDIDVWDDFAVDWAAWSYLYRGRGTGWSGSGGGISKYDGKKFETFTTDQYGLAGNSINYLLWEKLFQLFPLSNSF